MRVLASSSISATVTASVAVTKESEAISSRCSSVKPRAECDLIMKSGARTRRTRALIEKTYLDFLEEGNKGVNVAELCRRAHINRDTFYNHFDDIADVRESLENRMFEEAESQLNSCGGTPFSYDFFLGIIKIIQKNRTLAEATISSAGTSVFFGNVVAYFRNRYIREFSRRTEAPQERLSELFDYMLYGSVGVISGWLKNKDADDSAENIAARISRLNGAAIKLVLTD